MIDSITESGSDDQIYLLIEYGGEFGKGDTIADKRPILESIVKKYSLLRIAAGLPGCDKRPIFG